MTTKLNEWRRFVTSQAKVSFVTVGHGNKCSIEGRAFRYTMHDRRACWIKFESQKLRIHEFQYTSRRQWSADGKHRSIDIWRLISSQEDQQDLSIWNLATPVSHSWAGSVSNMWKRYHDEKFIEMQAFARTTYQRGISSFGLFYPTSSQYPNMNYQTPWLAGIRGACWSNLPMHLCLKALRSFNIGKSCSRVIHDKEMRKAAFTLWWLHGRKQRR